MKIAVYAIALNERDHVRRWASSAADADVRVICDTGSTDDTIDQIITADLEIPPIGAMLWHRISIKPFRFDDARNAALALVPDDVDVCIALDLDETLEPGWREEIERQWAACPHTTRLLYGFEAEGRVQIGHRIHTRHDYRWDYPIHEHIRFKRSDGESIDCTSKTLMVHRPGMSPWRANYLPMLAQAADQYPDSARMAYYYARQLFFNNRITEAMAWYLLAMARKDGSDYQFRCERGIRKCRNLARGS